MVADNISRWPDFLRIAVLAIGSFNFGLMIAIHHKTRAWPLPRPLQLLGVSYAIWQACGFAELYARFGGGFVWRSLLEAFAAVSGTAALFWLDRYYELDRRLERHVEQGNKAAFALLMELRQRLEKLGLANIDEPPNDSS